jgi:tRNA(Ile)-lysidine synthetase-like protein
VHLPGVGTRKLQDVLVDAKVPREARDALPLLAAGGEILWVPGVAQATGAAVGASTRRIVRAVYERRPAIAPRAWGGRQESRSAETGVMRPAKPARPPVRRRDEP